jgi:hydroxymethylglutaryl-CoA synthase
MNPGIISYGAYVPKYRITVAEIAAVWQKDVAEITNSLGVSQKSVAAIDEDAVTLALESALQAFNVTNLKPREVQALFVGSESHPYAVNPTSTTVGEFLGIGTDYLATDLQFACKAGSAGILVTAGLVGSNRIDVGMAIGSDAAQSRPHDILEYSAAAASAAFIIGKDSVAAELISAASFSSDTPDFWRRDGIRFPSHAGRFTGEPAYFRHVQGAARLLFDKSGIKPSDVGYCVFHMPNGRFPRDIAARLGFSREQLEPSLIVDQIGNPYSASSLLGLVAVLDVVKPGDLIFMVSYGSGAGSDALLFQATREIKIVQKRRRAKGFNLSEMIRHSQPVTYKDFLKMTHKI